MVNTTVIDASQFWIRGLQSFIELPAPCAQMVCHQEVIRKLHKMIWATTDSILKEYTATMIKTPRKIKQIDFLD